MQISPRRHGAFEGQCGGLVDAARDCAGEAIGGERCDLGEFGAGIRDVRCAVDTAKTVSPS